MIQLRKKIISQQDNLSSILYNRRKAVGFSISQVSAKLGIHPKYLRMLETGDYSDFPGRPYDKQYLKMYCEFLNLNLKELWNMFLVERDIFAELAVVKARAVEKRELKGLKKIFSFINLPRIILNSTFSVLVLSIVVYFSWTVYGSMQAPVLEIFSPQDNFITKSLTISIEGKTEQGADVNINGQSVINNNDGSFNQSIDLHEGINLLKITASKKHHKENVIYRQIMVVENELTLIK